MALSFDDLFAQLQASGLEPNAKMSLISHWDATTLTQIPNLWPTQQLNQNYVKYSQMIQQWLVTVEQLSLDDAAKESLVLGRQTIAQLMNDPLLPQGFVDVQLREQFALSVLQLDQMGLALWSKFYDGAVL